MLRNGGGAFIIPYLVALFLVGIPLWILETAYGQLIDCRLHARWGTVKPRLWGLSVLQFLLSLFYAVYYIVLVAWSWYFFFQSFTKDLPYIGDKPLNEAKNMSEFIDNSYLPIQVMHASVGIAEQGVMDNGAMIGYLWLSYFFVFLFCIRGVKSMGKVVYVTATLPYVMLLCLLIFGGTLEGAGEGVAWIFNAEGRWFRLGEGKTWRMALNQVLFSIGVVYGPQLYYGSARIEHNKILRPSVCIPFIDFLTSILATIMIYQYIGAVAF